MGSSITVICSMPVWSMTLTAILTPGSGSSNGMVVVDSILRQMDSFFGVRLPQVGIIKRTTLCVGRFSWRPLTSTSWAASVMEALRILHARAQIVIVAII